MSDGTPETGNCWNKKKKKLSKGSGSVFLIESSTINAVPDHRPDFKREGGGKSKTKQEVVGRTPGATAFSSLRFRAEVVNKK